MRAVGLLLVVLLMGDMARAETPASPLEVPQTLEEAKAQRARAESMRTAAEREYKAEENRCYGKFLVNDCLEAARKRRTAAIVEARQLEQPARDFERQARHQELEAREKQGLADQPQREAEQRERGERYRAEQAAKAAERERKLADKARQAEEGRKKTAAEQARRQAKLEKRARADAERAAKKVTPQGDKPAASSLN